MDLNSPKQIELCFTLEEKQTATRTHLVKVSSSCQMKSKPQASPCLFMGTRASPTKGGPGITREPRFWPLTGWRWQNTKSEACISLSLRGRADLGINKWLAERIKLWGLRHLGLMSSFKREKMEYTLPTQTLLSDEAGWFKRLTRCLGWMEILL